METLNWVRQAIETGNLCDLYKSSVSSANSKLALMRLALSGGAAGYLCEMEAKGMGLDPKVISKEFAAYINGRYIGEYQQGEGSYSSVLYCEWNQPNDSLLIVNTLTTFISSDALVVIPDYSYVSIYCDAKTRLQVYCPSEARCEVHYWNGAEITTAGEVSNITLILH